MNSFEIFTIFSIIVLAFSIIVTSIFLFNQNRKILDKLENNNYMTILEKLADVEKAKITRGVK